ncbi:hypothetical protein N9022_01110 [bacterium]|nr:hypothetical protein [Akkermansiaceae bacterium]MDA7536114.1 hypothetical protein [bacterium]MDA7526595.1 hypothetical protein [Akkermansiaceae bacterium]MDA7536138.1 hypothetical protein [bacterium]MDA7539867.1 hypothetical protein [Akkermansiaceae bacterium]
MPKLRALISAVGLFTSCLSLEAETVLWKANGAITSATGTFQDAAIESGTEVEIRITYNDQSTPDIFTNIVGRIETEYLTEIELTFEIKVGTRIWTALVNSAESDTPRTFVTRASSFPGTERVEMLISSEDNGTFFNFPLRTSERNTLIDLNFTSITNSFLTSGISAASIQPSEITHALGIIQTGSTDHQLTFSITPSTIEVLNEADGSVRPTAPKISSEINGDSISLSWLSDRRFRYRIEGTSNLSADQWVTVETRNGTSTQIFRSYPLANHFQFYRVVAIER